MILLRKGVRKPVMQTLLIFLHDIYIREEILKSEKKMPTPNFEILKKIAELAKQMDYDELENEIECNGDVSDEEWLPFSEENADLHKLRQLIGQYF